MVLAHLCHAEQDCGHLHIKDSMYFHNMQRSTHAQLKSNHPDLFITKWGDLNGVVFFFLTEVFKLSKWGRFSQN